MPPAVDQPWSGLDPDQVAELLAPVRRTWWVCGGWGIDLWLGKRTRQHADFDVGCWREDIRGIVASLPAWEAYLARDGFLQKLPVGRVSINSSLWLQRSGQAAWDIQLMPEICGDGVWLFRRDPSLRLPVEKVTTQTEDGFVVLRPEIQLLYKAKDVRPQDQADFDAVLPNLAPVAKHWLLAALRTVHPAHRWIDRVLGVADT